MNFVVFSNASVMLLFGAVMALLAVIYPATASDFAEAAFLCGTVGTMLLIASRRDTAEVTRIHGFLQTTTVWLTSSLVGALPLIMWGMSPTDAVFESISGLTTTGATVISGLDTMPRAILMWRAVLQGFGGVGFVVTGIALLPFLRTGGMQLFRTESSDKGEKELRSATRFALATLVVYLGLIVLCGLVYHLLGMSVFDAVTHAMTTLSTGGYSNYDASFGHFASPALQWSGTLFMLLGGLPFAWYIRAAVRRTLRSEQVYALMVMLSVVIAALTAFVVLTTDRTVADALRATAFNVVSVVTTTGYATEDYTLWGPFAAAVFFGLTAMGGCTGSTAGGAKMMRWVIAVRATRAALRRIRFPHRIVVLHYEGRPVTPDVITGVMSFFMFYFLTVVALAALLALNELDFATAVSGSLTAIANVGPGLGKIIGPAGNFATLDPVSKLLLAFGMFVGRLEMLTVYVLFTRAYWAEV